ncbi:MAG: ABC transporter ATP-binding protein/permease [Clostridiales bacterium]|nr:ABC transporter ATP-binding protein/permease [Clostridiales bacterium]MDY5347660.1 ABC transporter ATP-binding protein [Eubacteriales bacterium]
MLRTLAKSQRQYKKTSLLTMLCAMIEVVFEILIPLSISKLLDSGIEQGVMTCVWKYGAVLIALALMQMVTGILAARFGAKASVGFAANLRQDMYANVQTFAFSNIDKFSTASIVTRLTTDVTNVQNAYQMLIRMAIRAPFMLIFAMIVSFRISREISMIFLYVVPVLAVLLGLIVRCVHPVFVRVFKTYDELNNVVQENVRGIRVVKSFNQEAHETEKFRSVSERIYRGFVKAEQIITLNGPVMQTCVYTCLILISWFGAKAVVASGNHAALGLTTGSLTALFTYAMQILMSLMMLSMVFAMITIANSSAQRIAELLEEKTDIQNPEHPVYDVQNGEIIFDHVDFVYASKADKKVLDDISLTIRSGETIGIIGATGASKSSLVQLIPRLYDVTGGSLKLGGVDVRQYDIESLREAVAMVLQKNELFSGTIAENLRWGNESATDEDLRHVCKLACAAEFIEAMPDGYETHIEQGGANVSGGQKQRLCIARALLKKPKVLILDDSTSAVDTKTDAMIRKAFAEDIPETTKIIIAQRISSVQHADRVIVLEDGRIDAVGTHEELLRSCRIYREVFESQQKGDAEHA